jgi:transposase
MATAVSVASTGTGARASRRGCAKFMLPGSDCLSTARWTQGLADWIGCHVNALTFFGRVTRQIVCDNFKAGVTAASCYEPRINRTYQEWRHTMGPRLCRYGLAIRATKPRSKSRFR